MQTITIDHKPDHPPQSPLEAPRSRSLGRYAEFPSNATLVTSEDAEQSRKCRFAMLRKAAELLGHSTFVRRDGTPGYEAITRCHRWVAPGASHVIVKSNGEFSSFDNLEKCESPQCPICGLRRAETARKELVAAVAVGRAMGMVVYLCTFTVRHDNSMRFDELLSGLTNAYGKMFAGRWKMDFAAEWNLVGMIRAEEPTYGQNGWHPHIHMLMFCQPPIDQRDIASEHAPLIRDELSARWRHVLHNIGLDASDDIGVDVRAADDDIAEYIAKFGREPVTRVWGAHDELARSHAKKSHKKSLTPFQLLAVAAGVNDEAHELLIPLMRRHNPSPREVRAVAADLWTEAYAVLKGRHLLRWSPGLRALLNVDEQLQIMAANEPPSPEPTDRIAISRELWQQLHPTDESHFFSRDYRADLLAVALLDEDTISAFLKKHGIIGIVLSQVRDPS